MSSQAYYFVLGGPDLEMLTIQFILDERGIPYQPPTKDWNSANWESLSPTQLQEIKRQQQAGRRIVSIEISGTPPFDFPVEAIDHHGDRQDEPASLLQVAMLLSVELTDYQKLVAANDSGYIPAMKALGATEEEITQIRQEDRRAQGVIEADERQAEQDVTQAKREGRVTVVHTSLSRFSPITDRLYGCGPLVVYSDTELNFYGPDKQKVVEHFAALIKEGKAYDGGGDQGFFGLVKGHFGPKEIEDIKKQILDKINGKA